jgi:hypothetical protein
MFTGFFISDGFISNIDFLLLIFYFFIGILLEIIFKPSKENIVLSFILWPILTLLFIQLLNFVITDIQFSNIFTISLLYYFIPISFFYFLGIKLAKFIGKKMNNQLKISKKQNNVAAVFIILLIITLTIFKIDYEYGDYYATDTTIVNGLVMMHILEQKEPGEIKIYTTLKYASKIHSYFHKKLSEHDGQNAFVYSAVDKKGEEMIKITPILEQKEEGGIFKNKNFTPAINEKDELKLDYYKNGSETFIFKTKDTSEEYEGYIEIIVENYYFKKIFIGEIIDGIFYLSEEKVEMMNKNTKR